MYQTILTSFHENIFTITINRPDKLNAINNTVMEELGMAIDEVNNNPEIRSAIITGAGEKAFVAGADISGFPGLSVEEGTRIAKKGQDVFWKIERCLKPIIAAINGFALGGGLELALACHMRVAAENARFAQPEVNLGLIPGYGGTQRLVQLIGKGKALEMMVTGAMIDAQEAMQFGLLNYVVSPAALIEKTRSILNLANSKAPLAIGRCIQAANAVFDENLNGYFIEMDGFGYCFGTSDMREGVSAFLEKRKPTFRGR